MKIFCFSNIRHCFLHSISSVRTRSEIGSASLLAPLSMMTYDDDYGYDTVCKPKRKVVFLKTHKTGSCTMASIFHRYGFVNNLTFLVPDHSHLISYKKLFSTDKIATREARDKGTSGHGYTNWTFEVGYEMFTNHARFNKKEFDKVFHGAKYVTILREPVSEFESAFFFFNISKAMKKKSDQPLKLFMKNPKENFKHLQKIRFTPKVSMHNYQMFDLGLQFDEMDNETVILGKILELDSEFDLVMIQEYFDESLLLLRKMLCWEMDDIVFLAQAVRRQSLRTKIDDGLRSKISSWNHADMLLYRHFNSTFWRKLQDYGPSLQRDLALFRSKLAEAVDVCIANANQNRTGSRTVVFTLKKNASEWCQLLKRGDLEYTELIRRKMKKRGIPLFKMSEHLS